MAKLIAIVAILSLKQMHISSEGVLLAASSGALASGIGCTIWYSALRGLSATQAAVVQLSVPLIAAIGGVIFVAEVIMVRLAVSTIMILGGILLVVAGHYKLVQAKQLD